MACRPSQYRKCAGIATSGETPRDGCELPPLAACRLPAAFSQRLYLLKLASHWGHLSVPPFILLLLHLRTFDGPEPGDVCLHFPVSSACSNMALIPLCHE